MNYWTVYMHRNKINDKKYIGITCQTPEKRWGKDGCLYLQKKQPYFYNAIQKYGWDNFEHLILFTELTEDQAKCKEIELIAYYHTYIKDQNCQGYNMTIGGDGCSKYLTEEERLAAHKASNKRAKAKKLADPAKRKKLYEANMNWKHRLKIENPEHYKKIFTESSRNNYYALSETEHKALMECCRITHNKNRQVARELRAKLLEIFETYQDLFSEDDIKILFERNSQHSYKCMSTKILSNMLQEKTAAMADLLD